VRDIATSRTSHLPEQYRHDERYAAIGPDALGDRDIELLKRP
jgi:hypothetical protein